MMSLDMMDRWWQNSHEMRPLAPRQQQILQLLAEGRSNPEIADALGISYSAVGGALNVIYARIGVHNRVQATLWYNDHRGEAAA